MIKIHFSYLNFRSLCFDFLLLLFSEFSGGKIYFKLVFQP